LDLPYPEYTLSSEQTDASFRVANMLAAWMLLCLNGRRNRLSVPSRLELSSGIDLMRLL